MIRALAHGGKVLQEPRYADAAARAADFLLRQHRTPDGGLYRTSRDGVAKYAGFLDDYAFLTQALLTLGRKDDASTLASVMLDKFGEAERGGLYFTETSATDLIVRQKTASDSPLPSGNAVAAITLLELGKHDEAKRILEAFAAQLERAAEGMSSMVQAVHAHVKSLGAFEVAKSDTPRSSDVESPEQIAAGVVEVRARWESPTELHVRAEIRDGFHVNAHPASKGLIPTVLTVVESPNATIEYPAGEEERFAFADEAIRVYEGSVRMAVRFATPPSSERITVRLTYQACDDSACLPPVTKQFHLPSSST